MTVSTHSRLKAAGIGQYGDPEKLIVSTHSRLKAAGFGDQSVAAFHDCFNTQPPEGGWKVGITALLGLFWFQHPAA